MNEEEGKEDFGSVHLTSRPGRASRENQRDFWGWSSKIQTGEMFALCLEFPELETGGRVTRWRQCETKGSEG